MSDSQFGSCSGRGRLPSGESANPLPLVIAIHGGSYTSAYFDVPGYSLLDRAEKNGIPIIAIDRPGYGATPAMPPAEASIAGQARWLVPALLDIWQQHGAGRTGIFLIGHSIGGAIAASIASEPGELPLIGLAVSGVGLRTPTEHGPMWAALPDTPSVNLPMPVKDQVMFGPPGSFDTAVMPGITHGADAPAPKAELLDIVGDWQRRLPDVLGKIIVPVHYRQAEVDHLWIVDQAQIEGFAAAFTKAPYVDARMVPATGHCMDFHHIGPALQLQQLSFALQCAVEAAAR